MGEHVQGWIKNDDLYEWGEQLIDDGEYRNWGHLIEESLKKHREEDSFSY